MMNGKMMKTKTQKNLIVNVNVHAIDNLSFIGSMDLEVGPYTDLQSFVRNCISSVHSFILSFSRL